jgi:hypothetical protein
MEQQERERVSQRSGERVAFNDDIFRKANEEIRVHAEDALEDHGEKRLPIICECANETCTEVLMVPLREYNRIRSDPLLFFNARGHDAAAGGWAEVVEDHERYVVVEKQGRAAELSEMLDEDD